MDASGERQRRKVTAHTRQQAMNGCFSTHSGAQEEKARTLGSGPQAKSPRQTCWTATRATRKPRIRPTTFERLGGILATLKAHLPEQAKAITKRTIAEYIEKRSESVKPGTVAKEMSVLKHCLSWLASGRVELRTRRLVRGCPKLPPGRHESISLRAN
jgi:hypothetical protein